MAISVLKEANTRADKTDTETQQQNASLINTCHDNSKYLLINENLNKLEQKFQIILIAALINAFISNMMKIT